MKRWPTIPVAPRMPIGYLFFMALNTPVYRRVGVRLGTICGFRDRIGGREQRTFCIADSTILRPLRVSSCLGLIPRGEVELNLASTHREWSIYYVASVYDRH